MFESIFAWVLNYIVPLLFMAGVILFLILVIDFIVTINKQQKKDLEIRKWLFEEKERAESTSFKNFKGFEENI